MQVEEHPYLEETCGEEGFYLQPHVSYFILFIFSGKAAKKMQVEEHPYLADLTLLCSFSGKAGRCR
jgi:hypothetical protein